MKRAVVCLAMLVTLAAVAAAADEAAPPAARFEIRELYAPGHFGNSYEVLGEHEMRAVLAEAKFWGFNRYGDWFDMEDCSDPFAEKHLVQLAHAMWERKKTNFRSAQSLGLPCDLIITPNHVYVDQCRPEWAAKKGGRIFGQLICPSIPAARAVILKNYEHLFSDLAEGGVRLTAISGCPYDFGGCACDACQPWIVTYAKLMREIHAVALRYHPKCELDMIGWWWSEDEHRQFAAWADREAPGWVRNMYLHIPYGATKVGQPPLPRECRRGAFVHIGYAEQASPRDVYGHTGPVAAPQRIEQTVQDLAGSGVTCTMAYSEGVFDDLNKALLARLGSGQFRSADDVLRAYARRYFHADDAAAAGWAKWLAQWGRPFDVDPAQAAAQLAALPRSDAGDTWRRRQWELKVELFRANRAVGSGPDWTPARLAAVDKFWQVQEQIQRGLWGLAEQRHVFERRFTPVPWYASWAKHAAAEAKALGKEQ